MKKEKKYELLLKDKIPYAVKNIKTGKTRKLTEEEIFQIQWAMFIGGCVAINIIDDKS